MKSKANLNVHNIAAEDKKSLQSIAAGRKKKFELLLTPDNERESVEMEDPNDPENSFVKVDENGNCIPQQYDALRLTFGEDYVLVAVKNAYSELLVDDNNQPIILKEFGEEYYAENVVYQLGEVIETNVGKEDANLRSMKCLAIRQPWAQLIVCGIKDIECRNAMVPPKEPKVLIAASGTKIAWDDLNPWVQKVYLENQKKGILPAYKDLPTKCIIGFVDIVKASYDPVDSPWGADFDGMKYTLRNAQVLDEPIYGKNKATPMFYNVDGYDAGHLPKSHKAK